MGRLEENIRVNGVGPINVQAISAHQHCFSYDFSCASEIFPPKSIALASDRSRLELGYCGNHVSIRDLRGYIVYTKYIFFLAVSLIVSLTANCFAEVSKKNLDETARFAVAQLHVVGASVLVARGDHVLLHKAYGKADIGLGVLSQPDSVYHVVGPTFPLVGIAVMQQVERGKLSLDDDISKFVPEFSTQGHTITVRQLLNHTSGIPDYHYLGDSDDSVQRRPKAMDEVISLFAGRPWIHAPGASWDWTISDFPLLVTILERVTGEGFEEYVHKNILEPANATSTTYYDDSKLIRGLSTGYDRIGDGFAISHADGMSDSYEMRYCSTVTDLYHIWRALRKGELVSPGTLAQMSTAEGPTTHAFATGREIQYGLSLVLSREDGHNNIGHHGASFGHSASLYEFPADDLTVVVLSNVNDQSAYFIGRALARRALGLPTLPTDGPSKSPRLLSDNSISTTEQSQIAGTYIVRLPAVQTGRATLQQYRRTYRVFNENGRLMIEALGDAPERLLKQADGSFARNSSPTGSIVFNVKADRTIEMNMEEGPYMFTGARIGSGDLHTFYSTSNNN